MKTKKGIFENLTRDHQVYMFHLKALIEKVKKTEDLKVLGETIKQTLEFLDFYVEKYHQEKEEMTLYPLVAGHPRVNQGGPMCSFFYDYHMNSNPLIKTGQLVGKSINVNTFDFCPEHLKTYFVNRSPISIPLEDHLSTRMLLHFIRNEFESLINEPQQAKLRSALQLMSEIHEFHVQKEEKCFFLMCFNLFTEEDFEKHGVFKAFEEIEARYEKELLSMQSYLNV